MIGSAVQLPPDRVAPGGSMFIPDTRFVPEIPPYGAMGDDESALVAWVSEKWNICFQLKRGEQERIKMCELFYSGFHYLDPADNRNNSVTNFCRSTVETIWPILTEARPRPEPVPRRFMDAQKVQRLAEYATYKMDSTGFDRLIRILVRDLLKYGWCCPMMGWDADGRSVGTYLHPLDFYPDQATHEDELECFFIARPVATRRLKALFPEKADKIVPDNIASPTYECMIQPRLDAAGIMGGLSLPMMIGPIQPNAGFEGGAQPTSTGQWGIDTGSFAVFGQTTFLLQMFVRDYTTMSIKYTGKRLIDHDAGQLSIPHSMTVDEPCCPSGWRMVAMTANGTLLGPPLPVDICIGGIPVVIGRNYEQGGRFSSDGELDDVIPIQRSLNKEDNSIDRALDLQSNPPVITDDDSGLLIDGREVSGGEILRKRRGTEAKFLQPQSLAEQHFTRRAMRRQDIQIVAGTPDSLQGQRPIGVEAAAAIRQLTESGTSRARAKGPEILDFLAVLLTKMIRADIKKSPEPIYFVSSDGTDMHLDPADFEPDDFKIRWATGSGTAQGKQDRKDEDMELLQLGVIDSQQILEDLDFPGRDQILARQAIRQMQAAQAPQPSGAESGGEGKSAK